MVQLATSGQGGVPSNAFALPTRRVGTEIDKNLRWFSGGLGTLAVAYGAVLAWRDGVDGVAIASVFAVGLVALIFALTGVVPASVKVGDLEMKLAQAKEEGKEEGAAEGALEGVWAATVLRDNPASRVEEALRNALASEAPLEVPGLDTGLPLPTFQDSQEAARVAKELTEGLRPEPTQQD